MTNVVIPLLIQKVMQIYTMIFDPKAAAGARGFNLIPLLPLFVFFSKNLSSEERLKPCFFVTFNVIISHIFPENFIYIALVSLRIHLK